MAVTAVTIKLQPIPSRRWPTIHQHTTSKIRHLYRSACVVLYFSHTENICAVTTALKEYQNSSRSCTVLRIVIIVLVTIVSALISNYYSELRFVDPDLRVRIWS